MRNLLIVGLICASGLLAACGQKGPLVLPDAQKHKPTTVDPSKPLTAAPAAPTSPTSPTSPAAPAAPAAPASTAPAPPAAPAQSKDDKSSDAAATP